MINDIEISGYNMKIGDKVRFLSETGGGRISGFKGKNIVLVEDEDGFEIPTPINEVVVVTDNDYSSLHMVETIKSKSTPNIDNRSIRQRLADTDDESIETDEKETELQSDDDPSLNFTPKPRERKDGDKLSVYLAFVPKDIKAIPNSNYSAYVVNDSNYYIQYSYLSAEGNNWQLRSSGEIEPNTKVFIEELKTEQLNDISHACVQVIAYKRDKTFLLKPAIDVKFRIDALRFFKLHAFRDNDFFDVPALLYAIVENDRPLRALVVDPDALKKEMYSDSFANDKATRQDKSPARKQQNSEHREQLVRRYDSSQSKSHKVKQVLHEDKIVIDLHAEQLLDTTAGMSNSDILEYQLEVFRRTLEQYKDKKGQKLIFIHGKGEGVLRHAIIHELNYRYKKYQYQDASFQEYGYGATQITIR